MPAISLEGKTAIVTGASSGIGAATAGALRDAGVKVAVGARRADRLEGDFTHELDVTDPGSAERFVEAAVEALGGLDILVNNAGGAIGRYPFWESSEDDEEWEGGSLDPSSLLNVVGALAKLTGGLPVDPASGAVLS